MRPQKRRGASYIMVIAVFIFVSLLSVLMLSMINQTVYQTQTYSLQMQAQYINKTTVDAIVQALLVGSEENRMLKKVVDNDGEHFKNPRTGDLVEYTQEYYDIDEHGELTTDLLGVSKFTLEAKKYLYYGDAKDWVVITTVTTIPDTRAARKGGASSVFDGTSLEGQKGFEYTSTTMILVENPLVTIYNADSSLIETVTPDPADPAPT